MPKQHADRNPSDSPAILWARFLCVASIGCLFFTGCQSTTPSIGIEEAKSIEAEFKVSAFERLPRNIDSFKEDFQTLGPVPDNCDAVRAERQHQRDVLLNVEASSASAAKSGWGVFMSRAMAAEVAMVSGSFIQARQMLDRTRALEQVARRRSILLPQYSRLALLEGNLDEAQTAMDSYGIGSGAGDRAWLFSSEIGTLFRHTGLATAEHAAGNFLLAEFYYRSALKLADVLKNSGGNLSTNALYNGLVFVLLQQKRLVEAEAVAREAVRKSDVQRYALYFGKKVYETERYTGENAGAFALLSSVFLQQGRLDDARFLAEIAINMHEVGCSSPQSMGLNQARVILVNALAQMSDWSGVIEQVLDARQAMAGYPKIFDRSFGKSFDYAEALIYTGKRTAGEAILSAVAADSGGSGNDLKATIARGLMALARAKEDASKSAIPELSETIDRLSDPEIAASITGSDQARINRLMSEYMVILHRVFEGGSRTTGAVDIPKEMLRVAGMLGSTRVNEAFRAGSARFATDNDDLKELVRKEQDLGVEQQQIDAILAQFQLLSEEVRATISLDQLVTRLQTVKLARQSLNQEIRSAFPDYAELVSPRPVTVDGMTASLAEDEALIVIWSTEVRTYVWVARSDGDVTMHVSDLGREDIADQVAHLRQALNPERQIRTLGDIPDFDVALSYRLFRELLEPLAPFWRSAEMLYIVPDGALGSLPLSLLVTAEVGTQEDAEIIFDRYRAVPWLVRSHAVAQLPSVNTLRELSLGKAQTEHEDTRPFVGFGDPYFSTAQARDARQQVASASQRSIFRATPDTRAVDTAVLTLLPRLADTRDELFEIAETVGADINRDLFVGEAASEEKIKSTDLRPYRAVSFATHGLVPGDLSGLYEPALAFSHPYVTGGAGDGLLTMSEVLELRLNADLTILSACNTAAGEGRGAEAVSGLGRAFLYAGSRSILVSHWPVNSAATTALMVRFFRVQSENTGLPRAKAMQLARLDLIDNLTFSSRGRVVYSYAHPIYWAPFTLVGDGGI